MCQIARLIAPTGLADRLVSPAAAKFGASLVTFLFTFHINATFSQNNHNCTYVSPLCALSGASIATKISEIPA
jgi:hypothetical protein